ncbi:ribosome small subunit-dependent GTPase A [bacterium]|nr:ribosome small subunit-dependent GTPase A [bacterium]
MIGRIIKIHSDIYYVETQIGLVEAKLKTVLKKQKEEVLTGDYVELESIQENSKQAFIDSVVNRKNFILRPKVANVSQVIIVSALKEPDLDFEQLNRYISHCEYYKINPVLCFNKEDINDDSALKNIINEVYEKLGYKIVYTSALKKTGIEELKPILKDNTSILCGSSGAGKSSLINALLNDSRQRTLPVSNKSKKGVHTTRHCELIEFDKSTFIVDTPGFSHLRFDFLLPSEISALFIEFKEHDFNCKYSNCLHIGEAGCSAAEIVSKMHPLRYESYKKFVDEANEYKKEISKKSIKDETSKKFNQNRIMTKISSKKIELSRKTANQKFYKDEM